jgi:hypothetical protein
MTTKVELSRPAAPSCPPPRLASGDVGAGDERRRGKHAETAIATAVASLSSGCRKKEPEKINSGTIKNSVYSNAYFGFTLRIPDKWHVLDDKAEETIMNVGRQALFGEDKNLKKATDVSEPETVNLLTILKHPLESEVHYNPGLACIAEKIDHPPGIKEGKDCLYRVKQFLETSELEPAFPKEIYSQTLGGIDFDVLYIEFNYGNMVVKQKYYTTIMKGYALSFIISFATEEDLKSLKQSLESINFQ